MRFHLHAPYTTRRICHTFPLILAHDLHYIFSNVLRRLYSPLLAALEGLSLNGLVRPQQLRMLFVTKDLDAALDHIEKAIEEGKQINSQRIQQPQRSI